MLVHLIDFKIYSEYKCCDVEVLLKGFSKNPAKKENALSILSYLHFEKKSLFFIPTQTRFQNTSKKVIFIFIIVFFS
jgi:hypothetical protein